MDLSNLISTPGSVKRKKRVGRGEGSGWGKTAGRGHKGQGARSGGKSKRGKEGGQMPLYRRLPKRGFNNAGFKEELNVVNVEQLNIFDDGAAVSKDELYAKGIIRKRQLKIKILGNGSLEKKLSVKADYFSKSAKEKIEAKSGSCEEVNG